MKRLCPLKSVRHEGTFKTKHFTKNDSDSTELNQYSTIALLKNFMPLTFLLFKGFLRCSELQERDSGVYLKVPNNRECQLNSSCNGL